MIKTNVDPQDSMNVDITSIPIYRCAIERHSDEMKKAKRHMLRDCLAETGTEAEKNVVDSFDRYTWYPWKYNEIVGWISLEISHNKVTGELWYLRQKVSRNLIRKRYYYRGKVFEVFLNHISDQSKIVEEVFKSFTEWWETSTFSNHRYIDVDGLRKGLSFINWLQVKTAASVN